MRIISGKFRSRIINYISDEYTRPTTDKVKGAFFNSVGPYFDGGKVLDLFAGSGAVGIEAISRGMDQGFFVDNNREAIKIVKENLSSLQISNSVVIQADYKEALNQFKGEEFKLIFIDPPYKLNVIEDILKIIYDKKLLSDEGYIICEFSKENNIDCELFEKIKEANYSIRKIAIFQNKGE